MKENNLNFLGELVPTESRFNTGREQRTKLLSVIKNLLRCFPLFCSAQKKNFFVTCFSRRKPQNNKEIHSECSINFFGSRDEYKSGWWDIGQGFLSSNHLKSFSPYSLQVYEQHHWKKILTKALNYLIHFLGNKCVGWETQFPEA